MDLTFELLKHVQYCVGGGVVYLDCEDVAKVLNFFQNDCNRFKIFGERESEIEQKRYLQLLRFLEYKFSFDALIQDFDNEDKHPKDLGLVVVWTMGKGRWKERFQAISYLLPDYRDRRPYHGITHEMFDSMSSNQRVFYCIVLEELIEYLNNPSEYYDKFASQYSED